MEIEFRVFVKGRLIFRKTFAALSVDADFVDEIASDAASAFDRQYPHLRLDDPNISTMWCPPSEPLLV